MTDSGTLQELGNEKSLFMTGIITAFLSGMFAIRFMLKFLGKHGLHVFAYYRIALGVFVLLALSLG
jgi:undecaprenyl-diphosphatase